eukprot:gene23501-9741_t
MALFGEKNSDASRKPMEIDYRPMSNLKEGYTSFYRGVWSPLLIQGLKRAAQMAMFERCLYWGEQNGMSDSKALKLFSGFGAGVGGALISCPVHVLKIRVQVAPKSELSGLRELLQRIWASEGPKGFFRGLRHHVLKDGLIGSTYLFMFATMRTSSTNPD